MIITGTSGPDSLVGTPGVDTISGLAGNDTLTSGDTTAHYAVGDVLYGGLDNDALWGGFGDSLYGGDGSDALGLSGEVDGPVQYLVTTSLIDAGAGDDTVAIVGHGEFAYYMPIAVTILGGAGNDSIEATGYEIATATIDAGDGDDYVLVGPLDNTQHFRGPVGAFTLTGGLGNDTFAFQFPQSAVITDFDPAHDKIDVTQAGDRQTIDQSFPFLIGQHGADTWLVGPYTIVLTGVDAASIPASDFLGFPRVGDGIGPVYQFGPTFTPTSGDDHFFAVDGSATLDGGAGNDVLLGSSAADTLIGGPGNDSLVGNGGIDLADYTTSAAAVSVSLATGLARGEGTDTLVGVENLTGSAFADTLVGDGGANVLRGGGGADVLYGGGGANVFAFGSGDSTASALDALPDFQTGVDKIDLTGVAPTHVSLVETGSGTLIFADDPHGPQTVIAVQSAVQGDDIVVGGHGASVDVIGTSSDDTVAGGAGADALFGGQGNDVVAGGGGADALYGGAGGDTFVYAQASDSTASSPDTIFDFQTGMDTIDLSAVAPTHISSIIVGGADFLFIDTADGPMQIGLNGQVQAYDLKTASATTPLYMIGDGSGQVIIGGSGRDVLDGKGGNDVLIGGAEGDVLFGGGGADVFKYINSSDSPIATPDYIVDFQPGVDKIDLTQVHASSAATYGYVTSGAATFLFVDTGGDGVNDMLIQIGATGLHTSDILW